jgi:Holliday junction resolvase-like predicted endonuclease
MDAIIVELSPTVDGAVMPSYGMSGAVIESAPSVNSTVFQTRNMHGAVVEQKQSAHCWIEQRRTPQQRALRLDVLALNTEIMALTGYTNYPFKGFSVIAGQLFGITDDGLFILEGPMDNNIPIDSEFLTGTSDFEQDRLKTVTVIHADSTGELDILLTVDDITHTIQYLGRARPGRGLRGNRIAFGMKNKSGSKVTCRSIEPTIDINRKRAL